MPVKVFLQVDMRSVATRQNTPSNPFAGYIGGTALDYIIRAHPDWEYHVLVRDEYRAEPIAAKYPYVRFTYGTLEDDAILERASSQADIVVRPEGGTFARQPRVLDPHVRHLHPHMVRRPAPARGCCALPEQKYHDIDDIERLVTLPDGAHHRDVDKIAVAANSDIVKVAILCPPTIYGVGTGAANTRSRQVPSLARTTLSKGFAPIIGQGKTEWDHVHSDDLGELYVKLVDATQDPSKRDNPDIFGPHAYFFAENGSHKWADVAQWIAEEAKKQGYLPEAQTKLVSEKDIVMMEDGSVSWGRNSKGVAERARKYLGWKPKGFRSRTQSRRWSPARPRRLG
ncbi:hypothetical protein ACCO45_007047 [Purpureocillium lilacinum]|uniref:Uncharacterized protein n=1 Tax=Purpureocillium lilacinum TaxID=33203 RepID=A0ACC4DR92_PURLI